MCECMLGKKCSDCGWPAGSVGMMSSAAMTGSDTGVDSTGKGNRLVVW